MTIQPGRGRARRCGAPIAIPSRLILTWLLTTGYAFAQVTDPHDLPPLVVRAERPPQPVEEARAALAHRAGATTLVEAKDYRQGRAATLADVMAFAPGVYTQTRHGEEVRFSIRGSGIQRGFLLRGIQLYQDGIPIGMADGSGDYQSLDPLTFEYIEIWRGANALEYGSSSLGGAVNFVTPTGYTAPPARARLDAGDHGQRRIHAALAGAGAGVDGYVAVTAGGQDGWRRHSATGAIRVSANAGFRLTDDLEGRMYLQYVDSDMQMPGSVSKAALESDPRQAAPRNEELDASNDYALERLAARLSWTPSATAEIVASLWGADRDRFHPMVYGVLEQATRDTGADLRAVFDLSGGQLTRRLVFGAATARFRGVETRSTNERGRPGTATGFNHLDARTHSAYAEYSHGLTANLTLQGGIQAVHAERRLDNLLRPDDGYDLRFDAVNPKLGVLFDHGADAQVYANISRSFEPAPFGEAVVRPMLPLPDAQEATTVEVGWRWRRAGAALEATVYHSRVDGELLALTDSTGTSIGTANANHTMHRGLELGGSVPLGDQIRFRGTYLYSDFRFSDDAFYGNNRIAGIAPHVLRVELEWRVAPWLAVAPTVDRQAGTTWIDHANSLSQGGRTLLHLRLHGDLGSGVRWFADLRNVTGREYVASTAVQANARGLDGAYYFPGDPRSVYLGLEWKR